MCNDVWQWVAGWDESRTTMQGLVETAEGLLLEMENHLCSRVDPHESQCLSTAGNQRQIHWNQFAEEHLGNCCVLLNMKPRRLLSTSLSHSELSLNHKLFFTLTKAKTFVAKTRATDSVGVYSGLCCDSCVLYALFHLNHLRAKSAAVNKRGASLKSRDGATFSSGRWRRLSCSWGSAGQWPDSSESICARIKQRESDLLEIAQTLTLTLRFEVVAAKRQRTWVNHLNVCVS